MEDQDSSLESIILYSIKSGSYREKYIKAAEMNFKRFFLQEGDLHAVEANADRVILVGSKGLSV